MPSLIVHVITTPLHFVLCLIAYYYLHLELTGIIIAKVITDILNSLIISYFVISSDTLGPEIL